MRKIYYICFTRFPSEKAHSLYIAKHCESFSKLGHHVTLLVARRLGANIQDFKTFYGIRSEFVVKKLPTIDLLSLPYIKPFAHRVGIIMFGIGVFFYTLFFVPKDAIIFTPDLFVAFVVSLIRKDIVYEVHDYPIKNFWMYRFVAKRVYKIQTNNRQKIQLVSKDFSVVKDSIYAIHNGVNIKDFDISISKDKAREELGLLQGAQYAVYTGHLYGWKGVDTLAQAAYYMPQVKILFVGGTTGDVLRMKEKYKHISNVEFLGYKKHSYMPLYQKAADILVLPNTAKEEKSLFHTSPMKLFEYMASKRPIIASNIPSVREVLNGRNATLVKADSPTELAAAVQDVLLKKPSEKIQQAFDDVSAYTWDTRADKIMSNLRKDVK